MNILTLYKITSSTNKYHNTYTPYISSPSFSTNNALKGDFVASADPASTLGTITKFNSNFNTKKNEIVSKRQGARDSNYNLLNTAKKLLENTKQDRVCVCMSHRLKHDENITIKHNNQSGVDGRAYYHNVIQCSSVHTCILCNNRIMSKRSKEIAQAYDYFVKKLHGFVPMLTLTIPHYFGGDLEQQLELINQAYKRLMDDRIMRQVWQLVGKVGAIKGVEYTHGKNGHHNHIHSLMFLENSHHDLVLPIARWNTPKRKGMLRLLNEKQEQDYINKGLQSQISYMSFEDFIKFYWVKLCRDVGLGVPSLENGAVITEGDNVKSYIAKHKSAQEITNSRDKKAKHGNRNQWELLLDYQQGDKQAGIIFKEYAQAFSGGKLLRWSNGLKALLLIDEVDDETIAAVDDDAEHETKHEIKPILWQLIKRYNYQARLLSAVENDHQNGTDEYHDQLKKMIKHHKDRERKKAIEEQKRIADLRPPSWFNDHHCA